MKKLSKTLLAILISFVFAFPFTKKIKADIGQVNWDPYYAWCIEKDGIIVSHEGYGQEKVLIPYGARLYVWHSEDMDMAYDVNDSYFVYYGDYSFSFSTSIKGEHIRPVKKVPSSEYLTYENFELLVLDETKIYEGPASDYKNVATLYEGTTISSDYNDGMWAHITDEGKEGWIYFNQTSIKDDLPRVVIINRNGLTVENTTDIVLYDSLKNKDTNSIIPANSILNYTGNCSSSFERRFYYIQYNEENGWIIDEGNSLLFNIEGSRLFAYENVVLYDSLLNDNVVSVIQENDTADVIKMVYDPQGIGKYYCRYEGLEGWTSSAANCFVDSSILKGFERAYLDEDAVIYQGINDQKTEKTINKNESFLVISSTENNGEAWHYVKNKDKEGWIKADLYFYEKIEDEESYSEPEERTSRKVPDIMYYYVAGAFIISISSYVLIKYLNIKKK